MTAVLAYHGVRKSYGRTVALRDVSLEVQPGEVFGLLGPNGAGKTTLIRIGLDILRPDAGEVRLFGAPLHRDGLDRVSYLPEERGLYKKVKVLDALTYFARLKGLGRKDARRASERWLDKVGMGHVAKRNVETLSKGMSQKVQIAGALLSEPELCVLDEPFSGLDPVGVDMVKQLIRERRASGRATILSTHMMNQVEQLCDRVAVIHAGERVVYGTLREVRRSSSAPVVRVRVEGDLPELPQVARVVEEEPGNDRELPLLALHLAAGGTPAELLDALVGARARVHHFEEVLATMEEIFLRAVRGTGHEVSAPAEEAAE
ncbi:MAG: ATP-binding cassette domain-containing protein [Myxococcales bacterium]|nr:ATP-binding cassette domain-containing protein [Myxococcales bacterium]